MCRRGGRSSNEGDGWTTPWREKTAIRGKGATDGRLTIKIFFDTRGTFCYGDVSNVAPFHMWGSQEW